MSKNPIEAAKTEIVALLANNGGYPMTIAVMAKRIKRPTIQVSRAINSMLNAPIKLIRSATPEEGDGFMLAATQAEIEVLHGKTAISMFDEDEPKEDLLDEGEVLLAAREILSHFSSTKAIPEGELRKLVNLTDEAFAGAINKLGELGGLKIIGLEDFEERLFRSTSSTAEIIRQLNTEEAALDRASSIAIPQVQRDLAAKEKIQKLVLENSHDGPDDFEVHARKRKHKDSAVSASVLDKRIFEVIRSKGAMALSSIGRALEGTYPGEGKIARSRVIKRVQEMVAEGALEIKSTDSGDRYELPDRMGARNKSGEEVSGLPKSKKGLPNAKIKAEAAQRPLKKEKQKEAPISLISREQYEAIISGILDVAGATPDLADIAEAVKYIDKYVKGLHDKVAELESERESASKLSMSSGEGRRLKSLISTIKQEISGFDLEK